ncbi:MAG: dienelactone hydrolase family protein [Chitinophagales bacterium]|nr:dienelactone hydrolase family protein [Chitinophagales bacterium]
MKHLLIVLLCAFALVAKSQNQFSCCNTTATQQFAFMAADPDFKALHDAPGDYRYNEDLGKMITYKTPDGKTANAFEILTPYKTDHYLFIFHEWWGLNDYIKKEAARYFKELKSVNVIAIDLYDGQLATTQEEAAKLMQGVKDDRARAIIDGAIKYVGKQANIGTLGWCFGGGWSMQATLMAGKQAAGCVIFYGMPETNLDKLITLKTEVLGIFATQDQHISPAVVEEFKELMDVADKKLTLYNYDAVHAFANPSNPKHDAVAAADAFAKAKKFLDKQFYKKE